MRYFLTLIFVFSLASPGDAAWRDIFQVGKPKVEKNVCIECHSSDQIKPDEPEYQEIPAEWRKSWHYRNNVACQDCHGGDPQNASMAMSPQRGFLGKPKYRDVPEFCGKCHIGIMENFLESGHGKALKTKGKAPNCVVCHGSHNIQKAEIDIINKKTCGVCHSYGRAKTIKASLLLTEKKISEIDKSLKKLKSRLIATGDPEKTLFQTHAEFRTLFHTVDVKLVQDRTGEFAKKLAALDVNVEKGFQEMTFRQNFSLFLMFIFMGLGIVIFLLGRGNE